MNLANFSMDTITLAGSLESKLNTNVEADLRTVAVRAAPPEMRAGRSAVLGLTYQ